MELILGGAGALETVALVKATTKRLGKGSLHLLAGRPSTANMTIAPWKRTCWMKFDQFQRADFSTVP
ncbi:MULTISPECIES: hypothetical protein [Pseudomonas]|uniref:hypothetical protein n=1 Tax=Pseudomonas TaxID=286 RepID=UPI00178625B6|nr:MULTISPECIES: hypothetical protein [unclassified Pseudomonas]MBD8708600.1 hypothetical protein [Pseudomonas sp. CFBP 13711]MBD8714042.1 hypothetical protein [Pseudomonas sp. CFBP 13715]